MESFRKGFRVLGLGFGVEGWRLRFRVFGLGLRALGLDGG